MSFWSITLSSPRIGRVKKFQQDIAKQHDLSRRGNFGVVVLFSDWIVKIGNSSGTLRRFDENDTCSLRLYFRERKNGESLECLCSLTIFNTVIEKNQCLVKRR